MHPGEFLKRYRIGKGLSQRELADLLGLTKEGKGRLEKWEIKKGSPKEEDATLIRNFFGVTSMTDLTEELLESLFVEGSTPEVIPKAPMLPRGDFLSQRRSRKLKHVPFMVPFVSRKAQAGYTTLYDQVEYLEKLEHFPLLPGVNPRGREWRYFEVGGESMEPELRDGDHVLCSMVPEDEWPDLRNFYVYVIVTANEVLIKRINTKERSGSWILLSVHPSYEPREIPLADIHEVWVVRRHITSIITPTKTFDTN